MSYASQADLLTRFGQDELLGLTDRDGTGTINSAVVDRALADAVAEIDGYLAGKYTLPLATVPPILNRLACDIARYHLYGERDNEPVRKRYEDVIRLLRDISRGLVTLGSAEAALASDAGRNNAVQVTGSPSVFGRSGSW